MVASRFSHAARPCWTGPGHVPRATLLSLGLPDCTPFPPAGPAHASSELLTVVSDVPVYTIVFTFPPSAGMSAWPGPGPRQRLEGG